MSNVPLVEPIVLSVAQEVMDLWKVNCRHAMIKHMATPAARERWQTGALTERAEIVVSLNGMALTESGYAALEFSLYTKGGRQLVDLMVPPSLFHYGAAASRPASYLPLPGVKVRRQDFWIFDSGQDFSPIVDKKTA